MGVEAVSGDPLRSQGGDDRDAAFPVAQARGGPGRSTGALERFPGEAGPDPLGEGGQHLRFGYREDPGVGGDAAPAPAPDRRGAAQSGYRSSIRARTSSTIVVSLIAESRRIQVSSRSVSR